MINRSKIVVAAVVGLLWAQPLTTGTAAAQGMGMAGAMPHQGMGGMHADGSHFLMLLKSAQLTSEQQAQVQQILQSDAGKMRALHEQFRTLHEQIADKLLGTGAVRTSDLKPLMSQASRIQEQMNENMVDTAVAIRNILTPEQVNRLAQVHQRLQSLHKQLQSLMGSEQDDMADPSN